MGKPSRRSAPAAPRDRVSSTVAHLHAAAADHAGDATAAAPSSALMLALVSGLALLRYCVSLWPYSGHNTPPMYGDFEAQRHWMEITTALPVGDWYRNTTTNDLWYWGLDYPPLTAYVSWVFGMVGHVAVPEAVALTASRGHESANGKLFMRLTVLVMDVAVMLPAVLAFTKARFPSNHAAGVGAAAVALLFPGIILVDHGHFQYNCVSLGLSVWAAHFALQHQWARAAVAFCLALNFKQMCLYYAPAFAVWLLTSAVVAPGGAGVKAGRLLALATAALVTFGVLWAPFAVWPAPGASAAESLLQVLRRQFPFDRGLYEDKVANLWCALSPVLRIQLWQSRADVLKLCTAVTLVLLVPMAVGVLRVHVRGRPPADALLWALLCCGLAFFLASYQVHEKSILLPAVPAVLLYASHPTFSFCFAAVATFSMHPLLFRDGLAIPYWTLMCGYTVALWPAVTGPATTGATRAVVRLLLCALVTLHIAAVIVDPPASLPHFHSWLTAAVSCGWFCLSLVYGWAQLWLLAAGHTPRKAKTA